MLELVVILRYAMMFYHSFLLIFICIIIPVHATPRVVSTSGAITEIIVALGSEDALIGVDTTSTYPNHIQELPKIGYHRALSLEGILSLQPDIVLVTPSAGPPLVIEQLQQLGITVKVLPENNSQTSVLILVKEIAEVLGKSKQGEDLMVKLVQDICALGQKKSHLKYKPKVLFIMARQGQLAAGLDTKANTMIHLSGGENIIKHYQGYKPLSKESLLTINSEVIIVMGDTTHTQAIQQQLLQDTIIKHTTAGKKGQIKVVDGSYFLSFGPRFVQAAAEMMEYFLSLETIH